MIGSRIGSYEITAKLGEGGMGVVYRAKDSHLGREVALKVLPEAFTADPERAARFEREAKLLAQLNHPNIAHIYGLEASGETRALVMELVEGPTLAERLESGAFPLDESLSIARQIAEALEEAHEKGIVHRDLKPQNIKASMGGKVKVLDFGLAKAMDPAGAATGAGSASQLAASPTLTLGATQMGVVLGTAAYMSPEQAKGLAVDKRADIWAFGVLLHEMLTGQRLFTGESVTETLASVLRQEVDFAALPAETPPAVGRLLRRCLERNPRNRLHDIADARIVIDDVLAGRVESPRAGAPATAARSGAPWWLAGAAGIVLGVVLGVALGWLGARPGAPASSGVAELPKEFRQVTREPGGERNPSLSPDGTSVAFVKRVDGQRDVFVQRVDGRKALNLTADCAEDDLDPAFSPDGQWIAYTSSCNGGGVFVMGATGESARRVTERGYSPSWSPDGRELAVAEIRADVPWAVSGRTPLWAVSVETGARRKVSEHGALSPAWSPNGRRIAFWGLAGESYARDLWTVAADGSQVDDAAAVAVTSDAAMDWGPSWAPAGDALYFASSRSGAANLWRVGVDPESGAPRGAPEPVTVPSGFAERPSVSRDGRRLVFVDRNARTTVMRAAFDPVAGALASPAEPLVQGSFEVHDQAISPDGVWILFANAGMPANLHLVRADGTGYRQLTEGEHRDRQGHVSPDGRTIAFQSTRWPDGLGLVGVDGGGLREVALGLGKAIWEPRWSPDGRRLAINTDASFLIVDLVATPPAVEVQPAPQEGAFFSPHGWLAGDGRILGSIFRHGVWEGMAVFDLRDRSYRRIPALVDADGRRLGEEAEHDVFPAPLPDGRSFVFVDRNRLLLGTVEGGAVREIHRAPPDHKLQRPSLSRDGRGLTFLDLADESDVWLATFDGGDATSP